MNRKEPLIRLAKRDDLGTLTAWIIRIASIFAALILFAGLIVSVGYNPVSVYVAMIGGALGSPLNIQQTIKIMIPLLGASLAIAPAFKMKFWNIGVEGQITVGGICATYFALTFQNSWPSGLLLPVMCLAAAIGGGLWGMLPAVFRAKWGTNETLFTLMLNYIAIGVVKYLQGGPWEKVPKGTQMIERFAQTARMPNVWGVTAGGFLVLALVIFMYCRRGGRERGHGPVCRHQRGPGHCADHVRLRRHCRTGGIYRGVRHQLHPVGFCGRRRGLHGDHRGLAGPAQSYRDGVYLHAPGGADQGRIHHQHPDP